MPKLLSSTSGSGNYEDNCSYTSIETVCVHESCQVPLLLLCLIGAHELPCSDETEVMAPGLEHEIQLSVL